MKVCELSLNKTPVLFSFSFILFFSILELVQVPKCVKNFELSKKKIYQLETNRKI